jgi:hypothetical protein
LPAGVKVRRAGGHSPWGAPIVLADSITESAGHPGGAVIVSGSHAGMSVVPYALQARPRLVVFNDAGIGKDEAGVVALAALQESGIAACAVSHASARIGDAASTLADGVVSRCNAAAAVLGGAPGMRLRDWLISASATGSSPARR